MKRTLLNSNLSLVLAIALFLSFLSTASLNQSAELDETVGSVECLLSQDNDHIASQQNLFLPVLVYLPPTQSVFLQKDEAEFLPSPCLSKDTLRPFRGPPSLSA